jgi:hypothetical protein
MSAHKLVPHPSSHRALARMAKNLSFHMLSYWLSLISGLPVARRSRSRTSSTSTPECWNRNRIRQIRWANSILSGALNRRSQCPSISNRILTFEGRFTSPIKIVKFCSQRNTQLRRTLQVLLLLACFMHWQSLLAKPLTVLNHENARLICLGPHWVKWHKQDHFYLCHDTEGV